MPTKINALNTPVYVIDEGRIKHNLEILKGVEERTGCHILLAQKAFSAFALYPLIGSYISGATASGLYEARLAHEEMTTGRHENHVFEPAFTDAEMAEIVTICDHISFNSLRQLEHHRPAWEKAGVSVGIRINPEHSTQDHAIYDPCAPGSRLGVRRCDMPDHLPAGVEGIHFHTLCEQGAEPLAETVRVVEEKFGPLLREAKWINLGGGHHITRDDYNLPLLEETIRHLKDTYDAEIYLEPGEAFALNAGYLVTTVMDIVDNTLPILILDASAACHMPDVLEMPYRPPLKDSGMPNEKAYTCRLGSRTCLSGDIIGDYSFDTMPAIGDRLYFEDMAIYSMVKNNTFNGMPLPDIAIMDENGDCRVIRHFDYHDFKERLS
ncbi:MAG: carboxynorspermidine decarboxylase [Lachnospiraceae bacterium]|nr:carboxynorspermidine decarboxylase [Lachnospiraceae bacterium]